MLLSDTRGALKKKRFLNYMGSGDFQFYAQDLKAQGHQEKK